MASGCGGSLASPRPSVVPRWHTACFTLSPRFDFYWVLSSGVAGSMISQVVSVNYPTEHHLYLTLYVSNSGGVIAVALG